MSKIDVALLGFLYKKEMHGYDLFKHVSDKNGFGNIYVMKIGRLYSILNKLEEGGYVQSNMDNSGARPPRKVFSIMEDGKIEFLNWMNTPVIHGRDIRINLLIKLFFTEKYPFFDLDKILGQQIKECQGWLRHIQNNHESKNSDRQIQSIVSAFRKSQIEGYINWLKWCKKEINQ